MLHFHGCLAVFSGSESRAWHPLASSWVPLPSPVQDKHTGEPWLPSWVCLLHNAWVDSDYMCCFYDGGGMSLGFAQNEDVCTVDAPVAVVCF